MNKTKKYFFLTLLPFGLLGCQTPEQEGEQLAKVYCGSCHEYPDPSLLDKMAWKQSVLPNMAARMGFNDPYMTVLGNKSEPELRRIMESNAFYMQAIIDTAQWRKIQDFYLKNAPEQLPKVVSKQKVSPQLSLFGVEPLRLSGTDEPTTTYVGVHPKTHELYVAEASGFLYRLKDKTEVEKTKTVSPVSDVDFSESTLQTLEMGILKPNDAAKGSLNVIQKGQTKAVLANLARPVHLNKADLNKDGRQDLIICEHGDYAGKLAWYERTPKGTYQEHLLNGFSGARRTVINDWNKDGHPDVLAMMGQGREGIFVYLNNGQGRFVEKSLLKFSPVYGSSYFEVKDMNKDGFDDVIYTNGDNSDLSIVLKPYHGVRIFLNDGKGNLSEKYTYAMHGASKVMVEDFDQDGDMDMAATSYFPDLTENRRFVFFENQGNMTFALSTFAEASLGKWLVATTGDIDADGDTDIVLGSYPSSRFWEVPKYDGPLPNVMILRNQKK